MRRKTLVQEKSQKLVIFFGIALACAVAAALIFARKKVEATSSPDAPHAAFAVVERANVSNTILIAGEFLPYQEIEVHARVTGYVRNIGVDIGDHVHAGQVLATLEVPELTAQVEGADALIRHSQEEILRAQNEVSRAEANHAALHAASLRLRQAAAARPGLIAQQELDDSEAKDRESEAQVEVAKSAVSAAQQQLEISRASHRQFSSLSEYSRIVAPFDGVVTWRYADRGALVQAGTSNSNSQPVVKLAQVNVLRLRVPVPESIAASIQIGSPAKVTVEATGEQFAGRVARRTDALDRSTRTMQVEIDVPNQTYKLSPGMYANVALQVESHSNALVVPVQAVNRQDTKARVLVVDPDDSIVVRDIRTGLEDPNRVEVLSGLKEGERVVIGNQNAYRSGEKVTPKARALRDSNPGGVE
jgi:RND family efflux transporter MFP subunit